LFLTASVLSLFTIMIVVIGGDSVAEIRHFIQMLKGLKGTALRDDADIPTMLLAMERITVAVPYSNSNGNNFNDAAVPYANSYGNDYGNVTSNGIGSSGNGGGDKNAHIEDDLFKLPPPPSFLRDRLADGSVVSAQQDLIGQANSSSNTEADALNTAASAAASAPAPAPALTTAGASGLAGSELTGGASRVPVAPSNPVFKNIPFSEFGVVGMKINYEDFTEMLCRIVLSDLWIFKKHEPEIQHPGIGILGQSPDGVSIPGQGLDQSTSLNLQGMISSTSTGGGGVAAVSPLMLSSLQNSDNNNTTSVVGGSKPGTASSKSGTATAAGNLSKQLLPPGSPAGSAVTRRGSNGGKNSARNSARGDTNNKDNKDKDGKRKTSLKLEPLDSPKGSPSKTGRGGVGGGAGGGVGGAGTGRDMKPLRSSKIGKDVAGNASGGKGMGAAGGSGTGPASGNDIAMARAVGVYGTDGSGNGDTEGNRNIKNQGNNDDSLESKLSLEVKLVTRLSVWLEQLDVDKMDFSLLLANKEAH
jgi:hypothetical protein